MSNPNRITPSNYPPNGTISYTGGSPLIVFNIGATNSMLLGRTIRFNGKIQYSTGAGGIIGDSGVLLSNLGIFNALEQLSISSNQTGVDIETIRSYNRYLASAFKSSDGLQKQCNSSTIDNICNPAIFSASRILSADADSAGAGVDPNLLPFSCHLPCGLFSGDVPLSMDTTGGLTISIQISPDSNMFYGASATGKTNAQNCLYQLTDVHLTFEDRLMDPREMSMPSMKFNSISTFSQVISNNITNITKNFGLSNVLSVFMNFVPQININNYNENGMDTSIFLDSNDDADLIKRVNFFKAGVKHPIQFDIETFNNDNHQLSTELAREFKQCFTNNINTASECYRSQVNSPNNSYIVDVDTAWNFGIGVNYDMISNIGANFAQDQWSCLIEKTSLTPKPYNAYIFIKAVNTINFNKNGNISIDT
tara:strand:+ start:344 stop:1612 length:1269 start_codon:yes stop_codon:yes gene_type:complete